MKKHLNFKFIFAVFYVLTVIIACLFFGCGKSGGNNDKPIDNGDSNPEAVIPVLTEDYRELYHPSNKIGIYINDHTVFKTVNATDEN